MQEVDQDRLARVWVRLDALRRNLDLVGWTDETHVQEYHSIIQPLEDAGMNLAEFRVPAEALSPRRTSFNMLTGHTTYSVKKYVDKALFFSKLDALLGYFQIVNTKPPVSVGIGFSPMPQTGRE